MQNNNSNKNAVRVLHVIHKMNRGGAETMIMNLYRHIDRSQVQFDFLVHTDEEGMYDKEILSLGGRIYTIEAFRGYNFLHYYRQVCLFFKKHTEYKIVHGHIGSCAAFYLKAAKKNGCFTIAHSHNACTEHTLKSFLYGILSFPTRFIADQLIGCSKMAGESRYGKRMVNSPKYFSFYNAIDIEDFKFSSEKRTEFKKNNNITVDFRVYGTVGRITHQKNPQKILDIFKKIILSDKKSICIWIGTGEERDEIRNQIITQQLEDKILLLGVQDNVNDWLQIMDCFIFPSFWEGLPVTLIEAQASGLPCVISDSITTEIDITDLITRMNIQVDSEKWANIAQSEAMKIMDERHTNYQKIKEAGFEIADTAGWISDYYINIYKSLNNVQ